MAHKTLLLHLDDSADEAALREKLRELPGVAHVGEWDDDADDTGAPELTPALAAELQRRMDEADRNPESGIPMETVHQEMEDFLQQRRQERQANKSR